MEKEKFVVAVYVPNSLNKTLGGAFTYIEVLIDFLLKVEDDELCFKVILEGKKEGISQNEILVDYNQIKYSFKQRAILWVSTFVSYLRKSKRIKTIKNNQKSKYIVDTLLNANVDIIYYPNQHSALTDQFPFVINNWDLAHITVPPLPDTLKDIVFREKWYNEIATKAIAVFAESEKGKDEIQKLLNFHENRIKVLPIFPGKVVNMEVPIEEQSLILKKLILTSDNYFFYPAQFWALKNHYNLLQAFSLIDFENRDTFKIVFCGSDKNNKEYIKHVAANLGLQDRVVFLGFVSNEELYTLYKNCSSLVFPSLLGPTNMPILEAMELEVPVLCSNLDGHKEMLPNYLGMFDPLNSIEMSDVMRRFIFDSDFKKVLKEQLIEIKKNSKFNSKTSSMLLLKYFKEIKNFRRIWK